MTGFVRFIAPMPPYTTLRCYQGIFWLDTTTQRIHALYNKRYPEMYGVFYSYCSSELYASILTIMGVL